jgi:hypothetical protein
MPFSKKSRCLWINYMKLNHLIARIPALSRVRSTGFGTKFFMAAAIVLFASCKKEGDIGVDVLPESDIIGLESSDTTFMLTYSVPEDSVRTDDYPIVQIGSCNDALFGTTTSGLFTQLSIPGGKEHINFGSTAVLDSSTLWLEYEVDFYGDTSTPQSFDVYQMTEDIYKDSTYYSNHTKQFAPGPITSITFGDGFHPRTKSKYVNGTDTLTVPAMLRIPIPTSWSQLIFAQSGGTNLDNTANFTSWMKGLYITPSDSNTHSPGQGALIRFVPRDSLTRFRLYYHDNTGMKTFDFNIGTSSTFFSHFDHNYNSASTDLTSQLTNPGVNTGGNVYIQGASGVKTRIEFPYIDSWKNLGYPIIVNKAELVIKADPSQASGNFPLNKQLYLVAPDSAGTLYLLPDWLEGSAYFGGSLLSSGSEYRLNIARYFQRLVDGTEGNYGLYLKEIYPWYEGRRCVLGSGNTAAGNYRMYLHLVYTRVN